MDFLETVGAYFQKKYPQYQFFFSYEGDDLVLRLYHKEFRWPLSDFRAENQVIQCVEADLYYSGFRPKRDTELRPGFVIPSEFDPRDFFLTVGQSGGVDVCPVEYLVSKPELARLPSKPEVDYRPTFDAAVPVSDQGTSSMCVAYALTSLASFFTYQSRRVSILFSPEYVYHHRLLKDREGMSLKEGLNLYVKRGALPRADWRSPEAIPYPKAEPYRFRAYARVDGASALRYALSYVGPVLAVLPIRKDRESDLAFWRGRVTEIGHAVVFSGYNSRGFWFRNSWGVRWGERGYGFLPSSEVAAVLEAWALLPLSSSSA